MGLSRVDRERIAELRRDGEISDGDRAWLAAIRKTFSPAPADRAAIDAALSGARGEAPTFGEEGSREYGRRIKAGHFGRDYPKEPDLPPGEAEAQGFWAGFDKRSAT